MVSPLGSPQIARLCQLSFRCVLGPGLHTVRGGYGDDFGSHCGIRGNRRRIELDGSRDVGRGLPDAGDRRFLSACLVGCGPQHATPCSQVLAITVNLVRHLH